MFNYWSVNVAIRQLNVAIMQLNIAIRQLNIAIRQPNITIRKLRAVKCLIIGQLMYLSGSCM